VLSLQNDGTYKIALVTYTITAQEKQSILNEGTINLEDKITITYIDDENLINNLLNKATTTEQCLVYDYSYGACDNRDTYIHESQPFANGGMCTGSTQTIIGASYDMDCLDGISTDNGFPGSGTVSTNTGTSTNNQTNNGGADPTHIVVTAPVVLQPWQQVVSCLNTVNETGSNGYTPGMATWLQTQPKNVVGLINSLLQTNNCNSNSQINSILIIQTMMANSNLTIEQAIFETTNGLAVNLINSEAIDIEKELECFNLNQEAKLTIYMQQPTENTDIVIGQNQTGHAFIGIEQNGVIRQFGYYPETGASQALLAVGVDYTPEIRRNNNYLYHVSISQNISSSQLTEIVNYAINYPTPYNVNNYACTDYAIEIGNLGGMNLPSTTVNYITFSGRSLGVLGQEVRAMDSNETRTITTNSTNSPSSQGDCN